MIHGANVYPPFCSCKNMQTTSYEGVNTTGSYMPTIKTEKERKQKVCLIVCSWFFDFKNKLDEYMTSPKHQEEKIKKRKILGEMSWIRK